MRILDSFAIKYNNTLIMNENTKRERHRLLKKIIAEKQIGEQNQLLEELKKHGIEATQATVSRDLQELGVIKARVKPGVFRYEMIEKMPENVLWDKLKVLFKNFINDVKGTNNLILIKTSPGNANGVANFIDRLEQKEILGTIAGDDTILIVVDTARNRKLIERKFVSLLGTGFEEEAL